MVQFFQMRGLFHIVLLGVFGIVFCQRIPFEDEDENNRCAQGYVCVARNRCRSTYTQRNQRQPVRCGPRGRGVCCAKPIPSSPRPEIPKVDPRINPTQARYSVTKCGISARARDPLQSFITPTTNAIQGAWPWMVAITKTNRNGEQDPWCTGSLITRRHVLSAAHCFGSGGSDHYRARIGHVDQRLADTYEITRISRPQGYKVNRFYEDIALLTLSTDVNITDFNPVCLPPSRDFTNLTGRGMTAVGWGAAERGGAPSVPLKEFFMWPVLSNSQCNNTFNEKLGNFRDYFDKGISSGFICAGNLDEKGYSCGRDFDAHLMYQEWDRWHLVGISSFGDPCGDRRLPGGYTRVTEYLDWMDRNMD